MSIACLQGFRLLGRRGGDVGAGWGYGGMGVDWGRGKGQGPRPSYPSSRVHRTKRKPANRLSVIEMCGARFSGVRAIVKWLHCRRAGDESLVSFLSAWNLITVAPHEQLPWHFLPRNQQS